MTSLPISISPLSRAWKNWFTPRSTDPDTIFRERTIRGIAPLLAVFLIASGIFIIAIKATTALFIPIVGGSILLILCAAVADYKPAKVSSTKIKKHAAHLSLELVLTRDILNWLGHRHDRQFVLVGFAAETDHVEENAAKKLRAKNCDIIVANDVSTTNSGMDSDMNEVTILFRDDAKKKISRAPKKNIARELVKTDRHKNKHQADQNAAYGRVHHRFRYWDVLPFRTTISRHLQKTPIDSRYAGPQNRHRRDMRTRTRWHD